MPKRYSEEERRRFCVCWKSSHQSKISFCKEHGISESALHKWLATIASESSMSPSALLSPLPPLPSSRLSTSLTLKSEKEKLLNFLPIEVTSKDATIGGRDSNPSKTSSRNDEHAVEIVLPNGIVLKAKRSKLLNTFAPNTHAAAAKALRWRLNPKCRCQKVWLERV